MVGHSHHASHEWLSTLLAIRLPLYPELSVRMATRFPVELARGVLAGELSMALVITPSEDAQITTVPFARAPPYAALSENYPAAAKENLRFCGLAADQWILFARQVPPVIYEAILNAARMRGSRPKLRTTPLPPSKMRRRESPKRSLPERFRPSFFEFPFAHGGCSDVFAAGGSCQARITGADSRPSVEAMNRESTVRSNMVCATDASSVSSLRMFSKWGLMLVRWIHV